MLNVLHVIIILNLNNDEVMSRSTRGEQVLEYLRVQEEHCSVDSFSEEM